MLVSPRPPTHLVGYADPVIADLQDEKGKPLKYSVIARDGYNAKRPVE